MMVRAVTVVAAMMATVPAAVATGGVERAETLMEVAVMATVATEVAVTGFKAYQAHTY